MKFLLINTNSAVEKIFTIAAKKASIKLDTIRSILDIPLQEDYSCIFIDDGVLDTGDFKSFKNKMITTKFCLILARDKALISGFDSYIRKPFLPSDIYDVLQKEKYSDMNFSSYDNPQASQQKIQDLPDITNVMDIDIPAMDTTMESININNNANNINNIDLSEFSDSDDEFLSGIKDTTPLSIDDISTEYTHNDNINNDDMSLENIDVNSTIDDDNTIDFTYNEEDEHLLNDVQTANILHANDDVTIPIEATSNLDFIEQTTTQTSTQPIVESIFEPEIKPDEAIIELDEPEIKTEIESSIEPMESTIETTTEPIAKSLAQEQLAQDLNQNTTKKDNNDDIDFSSIFALQDEFLQSQQKNKTKGLVGGDIYTKKEATKENQSQDSKPQQDEQDIQNTQSFDELEDIHNDLDFLQTTHNDIAESSVESNVESSQKDSSTSLNDDINGDKSISQININDLSDDELDSLDDEALLKLQEDSLNDTISTNQDMHSVEPQILNKDDINELTGILEETIPDQNNLKIHNNELSSLTQEALSEVLDETNTDANKADDFSFDNFNDTLHNDFSDDFNLQDNIENNLEDNLNSLNDNLYNEKEVPLDDTKAKQEIEQPLEMQNIQNPSQQTNTQINAGDLASNINVDLSEIIKSFPVDKLRELLSGVQITINITFPNKKQ